MLVEQQQFISMHNILLWKETNISLLIPSIINYCIYIKTSKMSSSKPLPQREDLYAFQLKSISTNANPKYNVQTSYCPLIDDQTNQQINRIPKVEAVKNQYLNTFFCPFQYPTQPRNVFAAAIIYKKMKDQLTFESDELYVARPKTVSCMICGAHYDDYIEHIQQNQHRNKQNKNIFTGFIKGLCHKFGHYRHSRSSSKKKANELRQSTVEQSRKKDQKSYLLENVDRNDELLRQE